MRAFRLYYNSNETTHTPQGDGNQAHYDKTRNQYETTHTPQGDGNFVFINIISV